MSWWSDLVQKNTQRDSDPVLPKTGEIIEFYNSETDEFIGLCLVVDDNFSKTEIRFYEIKGNHEGQNMKADKKWFIHNSKHWKVIDHGNL